MKDRDIYLLAAKKIEAGEDGWLEGMPCEFACEALWAACQHTGRDHLELCKTMKEWFRPRSKNYSWLSGIGGHGDNVDHDLDGRILALCFMACLADEAPQS